MANLGDRRDIQARVEQIFRDRAQETFEYLDETFNEILPGNHSPAEELLLAHFLAGSDGYNDLVFDRSWPPRGKSWGTRFCYLAKIRKGEIVDFAFQVRHDDVTRELAILIDQRQVGQRTPHKQRRESLLMSLGFRVMSFSEPEILTDSIGCYDRVNALLGNLNDEVLTDAGILPGRQDSL